MMKVRDILITKGSEFESISPEQSVKEAITKLLEKKIGSLLVVRNNELLGIVTDRDLFWRMSREGDKALNGKVADIMTTKLIVGLPDDDIDIAMAYMTNNRFRHLPILDGSRVVGIISIGDIVKTQVQDLKVENRYLMDYITGKYPA
ncbi:MAG: CBS domain-containing protein [Candidatus Zixiibacteriota bacterium]